MIARRSALPGPTAERSLWIRLLDGEPTASADLAEIYLDALADWLTARNPRVDPHFCATAAENALWSLMTHPASYDPDRGALWPYLRLSADGDLKNLLRSEERHQRGRLDLEIVELSPDLGKYLQDDHDDPSRVVELRETIAEAVQARSVPTGVLSELSPTDMEVLRLMQEGERRNSGFVRVLGLQDASVAEQRAEVKRVKDRIKQRLRRAEPRTRRRE